MPCAKTHYDEQCGAMCEMVATHCTMRRTHYAHVVPCVQWRQLIVPCPELTMHMWRHVNGSNSLCHAQNSLCTCGTICKMVATSCTMPRTTYAHVAPCIK
jgi:hypothetical protein